MKYIFKIIDLYIYSSLHIAIGASLSIILCYGALIHIPNSNYAILVFTATLFMYCSHRVIGLEQLIPFHDEGRFAVIKRIKTHIIFYAILGFIGTVYFFWGLEIRMKIYLIFPAIISFFYISPVFTSKKRLRDFNYIKIFLIAIIWGLIIGLIPYLEVNQNIDLKGLLYFLEKTLFIFAITIPFDIRDMKIDSYAKVKTLPNVIGIKKSIILSYLSMMFSMISVGLLYVLKLYSLKIAIFILSGYALTILVIHFTKNKKHDYYFGGLLDGTIIMVALLGIVGSGILGVLF